MDQASPVPMDHETETAAANAGWQRADVRESMLLMATIRPEADGASLPLRVRNLSAGGLMAETDRGFAQGERVAVVLRGVGEVSGTIAWAGCGRIGMRFDRPIDPKATRKPVVAQPMAPRLLVSQDGRRPGLR